MASTQGQVDFHLHDAPFPEDLLIPERTSRNLKELIHSYRYRPGSINIILCSDKSLQEIHESYLQKEHLTDIITFDYVEGDRISGDLFISLDRIRENASEFQRPPEEELHRVMAHGILHLLGYKDKSSEDRSEMREAENEALREWGFGS